MTEAQPATSRELDATLESLRQDAREYKTLEFRARRAARAMAQDLDRLQRLLGQLGIRFEWETQSRRRQSDDDGGKGRR